jgi:hypothetical protein
VNYLSATLVAFCALAMAPASAEAQTTLRKPGSSASSMGKAHPNTQPKAQPAPAQAPATSSAANGSEPVGRYLDTARLAPGATRQSRNPAASSFGGLAWDPTGRYLLHFDSSVLFSGRVFVLNAGSFATVREHRTHKGNVLSAVFSKDGKLALTASGDKTAQIWNIVTGNVEQTFAGHTKAVRTAYFSADQTKVLTASDDGQAILWDRVTGAQAAVFPASTKPPLVAAFFLGDGRRVATISQDGLLKVWDIASQQMLSQSKIGTAKLAYADIAPNGYAIATSATDGTVYLTDMRTGETKVLAKETVGFGFSSNPSKVRFSPNGKVIGVAGVTGLTVLSAADGAPLDKYTIANVRQAFGLTMVQGVEFTFAVDSLTVIMGPIPVEDPATGRSGGFYMEWRPEF